jgi:hypothetical protein
MGYKRFVVFLIDGLSPNTLEECADAGLTPHLSRYIRQGSYHPNVIASFPTVTGPAHVPLFSGYTPASINLVGHNQFIREEGRLENYLLHYKTFEKRFGKRPTLYNRFTNSASIAEPFRFGASVYRKNIFGLADWARVRGPANWYVLQRTQHEYRAGRDLIVAWLHETDGLAHMSPNPDQVKKSLQSIDRWLGKFEKEVDQDTCLVFVSDHGMERTDGKPFSVRRALKKIGESRTNYRYFLDGGAFAQVYYKKNGMFGDKVNESELDRVPHKLVDFPEIDLALYRGQRVGRQGVVILAARGQAFVSKQSPDKYAYVVERGQDPLGLVNDPQTAAEFEGGLDAGTCLRKSGNSNYPDGYYQVYELLMAPAAGDLVVTAARGKGFNMLTRFGVHGGLNRQQAQTFMLFSKPVTGLDEKCLRTADLPEVITANQAV